MNTNALLGRRLCARLARRRRRASAGSWPGGRSRRRSRCAAGAACCPSRSSRHGRMGTRAAAARSPISRPTRSPRHDRRTIVSRPATSAVTSDTTSPCGGNSIAASKPKRRGSAPSASCMRHRYGGGSRGRRAFVPPHVDPSADVRDVLRTRDHEQRPLADADVARILEQRNHVADEAAIVAGPVLERHQHIVRPAIPPPVPGLVGPADAEREIGLAARGGPRRAAARAGAVR